MPNFFKKMFVLQHYFPKDHVGIQNTATLCRYNNDIIIALKQQIKLRDQVAIVHITIFFSNTRLKSKDFWGNPHHQNSNPMTCNSLTLMTDLHDPWKLHDNRFVCNCSVPSTDIFLVRLCCVAILPTQYQIWKSRFFNSELRMNHNFYIKKEL